MRLNNHSKTAKILISFFTFFLIVQIISPVLFLPQTANAQMPVTDPGRMTQEEILELRRQIEAQSEEVYENVLQQIFEGLVLSATISLKNIAIATAQKAGEYTYSVVTTGDWGQGPMFHLTAYEVFQEQILEYTVGELLDELSTYFWPEYFDICDPDFDVKFRILTNIQAQSQYVKRVPPRCRWSKVKANWEDFIQELENMKWENLEASSFVTVNIFAEGFSPKQSELGTFMWALDYTKLKQEKALQTESAQRQESEGWRAKTDITGQTIQNPPGTEKRLYEEQLARTLNQPSEEISLAKEVATTIPQAMVVAFVSSFVSQKFVDFLFDQVKEGFISKSRSFNVKDKLVDYGSDIEKTISRLKKINFSVEQREVDLITEFSTCLDYKYRNVNNCVIDEKFADGIRQAAIDEPVTVRQAIEQGYLDAGKPLVNDKVETVDECYKQGYCYTNLIKLRKARVLPIGWEMAAEQVLKNEEQVTLDYVIKHFEVCNNCDVNDCRFCHLIDDEWVLKYPKTICEAEGPGAMLVGAQSQQRYDYCADLTNCIKYNEDGTCAKFAYCAAEKNIWRFGGSECPGEFDSCLSLQNRQGQNVSYILNTVDFANCGEDNVGCQWYSTWLDDKQDAVYDWAEQYPSDYFNDVYNVFGEPIAYLNSKALDLASCSPQDEGCTELIKTGSAYGVNLVPNSGFDYFDLQTKNPQGWNGSVVVVEDGYQGYSGQFTINNILSNEKSIHVPKKNFPRYFYASAQVKAMQDDAADLIVQVFFGDTSSAIVEKEEVDILEEPQLYYQDGDINAGQWSIIRKVIKVPPQTSGFSIQVQSLSGTQVDNIILSEIEAPTTQSMIIPDYSNYGSVALTSVKKAPDHYACYDYTKDINVLGGAINGWYHPTTVDSILSGNDSPECVNFAQMCAAEEVGCQYYQPTDNGSFITGVVSSDDYCPAECAGYQAYSQSESFFTDSQFPLYLIADTGQSCNSAQVGCEEFTNLDELEAGGEGLEYYSQLRQCIKPDALQCQTFYTWASSEVSGFQLQAHNLKAENNLPALVNYSYTVDGKFCSAATYDPENFPACRQYYNSQGKVFYAFYENTITCSEDCHPYRRTEKYESEEQCQARGGQWKENGECIFLAIPAESISCGKQNSGCLEYKGNYAADTQVLMDDTFDINNWNAGTLTIESMVPGGHSLRVQGTASTDFYGLTDKEYAVDFWAKGPGTANIAFYDENDKTVASTGFITISNDDFSLYSAKFEYLSDAESIETIKIITTQLSYPNDIDTIVYFDSIKVKTLQDTYYLIKDSWSTPDSCDQTLAGEKLAQAQLGCQEYQDGDKNIVYLKSFRSSCRLDAVGCQALINTQNTDSPFGEKFDNDYYTIDDNLIYLVVNDEVECQASEVGCSMLGQPTLAYDYSVKTDEAGNEIWNNVLYKLDPDNGQYGFETIMCQAADSGCEQYTADNGKVTYYFKDPGERLCEWRLSGGLNPIEGWYQVNAQGDVACATTPHYGDQKQQLLYNSDNNYDSWVGLCDQKYNLCTAFIDPVDVSGGSAVGQAYYYLNDENIDRSCSGVSKEQGCLLFTDTSMRDDLGEIIYSYNANTTYIMSAAKDGDLVSAQQGECTDPTNTCASVETCVAAVAAATTEQEKAACLVLPVLLEKLFNIQINCTPEQLVCSIMLHGGENDTNSVIRVVRDRECAQWYDCKSGYNTYDPAQNRNIYVCQELGLCDSLSAVSTSGRCGHFVNLEAPDLLLTENEVITTEKYQDRPTGWNSIDYSGYTIPDKYPLQFYNSFDINAGKTYTQPDYKLVHYTKEFTCTEDADCQSSYNKCLGNDVCAYVNSGQPGPICRIYAQSDAPFPQITQNSQSQSTFNNVNLCEDDDKNADCGCNYQKVTYGNGALTKYFPPGEMPQTDDGYCQDYPDRPCTCGGDFVNNVTAIETATMCASEDCYINEGSEHANENEQPGFCLKQDEEIIQYTGWQGYCLEEDLGTVKNGSAGQHPCLTWYPLDSMAGLLDLYNQYDEAGFWPADLGFVNGGPYYCLASERWEMRYSYNKEYSGYFDCDSDEDNPSFLVPKSVYNDFGGNVPYITDENGEAIQVTDNHMKKTDDWKALEAQLQKASAKIDVYEDGQWIYNQTKAEYVQMEIPISDDIDNYYILENGGWDNGGGKNIKILFDPNPNVIYDEWDRLCEGIADDDYSKLKKPSCEDGYVPEYMYYINRIGAYSGADAYMDKFSIKYVCVPTNSVGGSDVVLKVSAVDGQGAYQDTGGTTTGSEIAYNNCSNFISAADIDGENKAYTNKIYQEQDLGSCKPETGCSSIYGAIDLAAQPAGEPLDQKPYNVFIDSDDNQFECTEPRSNLEQYHYGGTKCLTSGTLYDLFAATYGSWYQTAPLPQAEGKCVFLGKSSEFTWTNPEFCTIDDDCSGILIKDKCIKYKLQQCASAEEVTDEYCFLDSDCGEGYACTQEINNITKNLCSSKGGKMHYQITGVSKCIYGDDIMGICTTQNDCDIYGSQYVCQVPVEVEYCYKSYTELNHQYCNADDEEQGYINLTDPTAYCFKESYSSSHQESLYEFNDPASTDDKSYSKVNHPPVVAATVVKQEVSNTGAPYDALPGAISVNERVAGDIIEYGQKEIFTTFYAWADDDQMPLRYIKVDYGDGSIVGAGIQGKYKNHKPVCQGKADEPMGLCRFDAGVIPGYSCFSDADCMSGQGDCILTQAFSEDRFGDTAQACEEKYFRYNHLYSCDGPASVSDVDCSQEYIDAPLDEKYKYVDRNGCWDAAENACVFVPRVQVLDNWGWCNADQDSNCDTPNEFSSGLQGCYEADSGRQCDTKYPTNSSLVYNPWAVYQGRIIVKVQ